MIHNPKTNRNAEVLVVDTLKSSNLTKLMLLNSNHSQEHAFKTEQILLYTVTQLNLMSTSYCTHQ